MKKADVDEDEEDLLRMQVTKCDDGHLLDGRRQWGLRGKARCSSY